MSWNPRTLDSLLGKSGGDRAGKRNFPVLSITMRDGLVDQSEKFKKRVASLDTTKYRVAYRNELVVGFPIDEGVLGFQTKYPAGIVSPAYDIWKLKAPDETHIPYLERYLRSTQARHIYAAKMQGAVARRRSLTKADFLGLEIPLPPLDDQKRIAHLLGKVEGLIARRKHHLQQLDDLLKSVFLEMFGDPVRNEKGWERTTIGELATEVKYGTSASAQGGPYKYLRMNNITQDGYWDFDSLKHIDVPEKDFEKYSLRKGDLVFNRTNSKELVGKTAVYDRDEPVIIAGYLIRVRFDEHTNPWFVWGHLNSRNGKTRLFNLCRNIVGMANINAKELQAIPILNPPIELQNQFAAIVEKVEGLKSRYQHSLTDLETLYGALSQKAFKGELDLSRVPLSVAEVEQAVIEDVKTKIETDIEENHQQSPLSELVALTLVEGRKALLDQLLPTWLDQLGGTPFSAQHFMAHVEQQAADLIDAQDSDARFVEHEDVQFGPAEYDHLKTRIFESMEQGRLTQGYDDANNRVQVRAAQE
jgi:type I restriction enzyme S subunit